MQIHIRQEDHIQSCPRLPSLPDKMPSPVSETRSNTSTFSDDVFLPSNKQPSENETEADVSSILGDTSISILTPPRRPQLIDTLFDQPQGARSSSMLKDYDMKQKEAPSEYLLIYLYGKSSPCMESVCSESLYTRSQKFCAKWGIYLFK